MKARWRTLSLILGILGITAFAFFRAPAPRLPWILVGFLCFSGIIAFDSYRELIRSWTNSTLFLLIYGLAMQSCLEVTAENFWRDQAGIIFFITVLFEQNSLPWGGRGVLRSTMVPAVIYFILVLAQTMPAFSAPVVFGCALGAILIFSFLELFSIFRENNDMNSGSFMSALRSASCGLGSLFYSSTFLPDAVHQAPGVYIRVALPALGFLVAMLGLFFKQWRRRYILFCCNWSLFIFWAAITANGTNDGPRFFAAVGALIAGVWTIMMTNKRAADAADTRDLYLKLSAWGVPGSLLFSMIVFSLFPSENPLVQVGSVLWLLTFFVYWSGLRKFELPKKQVGAERDGFDGDSVQWTWRNSLALSITVAGAGLLAGVKYFPDLLNQVWQTWQAWQVWGH